MPQEVVADHARARREGYSSSAGGLDATRIAFASRWNLAFAVLTGIGIGIAGARSEQPDSGGMSNMRPRSLSGGHARRQRGEPTRMRFPSGSTWANSRKRYGVSAGCVKRPSYG